MEEKKQKNLRLSTVFFLIIILLLIGGIVYFVLQNNEIKVQSKSESQTLQNKIKELENAIAETKIIETDMNDNSNSSATNISTNNEQIDVAETGTEENYKKYNSNGYHVKIEGFDEFAGDDIEITTQIYKEIPLPDITKEQYQKLENGETIEIKDYSFKKSTSYKGEHDCLIYYPTMTEDHGPYYYVDKNKDGTGKLSYADIIECTPTDKWMRFIVNKNISYKSDDESTTLSKKLHHYEGTNKVDTGLLTYRGYNSLLGVGHWNLIFKNGKCIGIEIPNVIFPMEYED